MWDCRARLSKPYDGDSFWVLADTMYGQRYEPELRLLGVYAPEIRKREPGARETTAFVQAWFDACDPALKWPIYVLNCKTKVREPGHKTTLTRYLATVWRFDGEKTYGPSLNDEVNAYLAQHPQWGRGTGAKQATQ
jgi:hypothetical protein